MDKKKRKLRIAGLHLWAVAHTHSTDNDHLWITTSTKSLQRAIGKAQKFLDAKYEDAEIEKVDYQGTLDA